MSKADFGYEEIPEAEKAGRVGQVFDRVAGRSKMNGSIVLEAMLRVTGWGVARLFRW